MIPTEFKANSENIHEFVLDNTIPIQALLVKQPETITEESKWYSRKFYKIKSG